MNLPPYGSPPAELNIVDNGARPTHWSGSEAEWFDFYGAIVEDIGAYLWPRWDASGRRWDGPAAAFAEEATRLENEICIECLQKPGVLQTLPHTPNYAGKHLSKSHYWHYQVQDNINVQAGNGELDDFAVASVSVNGVVYYDDTLDRSDLSTIFRNMWVEKYNGIFQTKLIFRRPRPQQSAFMFGQRFEHHQALSNVHTGNHPSMISGHCAQGLLYMCALVDRRLEAGTPIGDIRTADYGQYAVDFGDRRVFAGVHYPTDNIASWSAVVQLIPYVFPQNGHELVEFVKNAIFTQSTIYRIIRDTFPRHEVLSHALEFLDRKLPPISG